ncbi:unnamed protein product [Caenorhabditis angaria]|uniref:BZIP domain-containing protein n=1 Tax=Caenorhabditis angaria TaxID=860376 RepID=A0A9P1I9I4_9PELO|nr:unnamed protein product [Caenorhabditis angaria]
MHNWGGYQPNSASSNLSSSYNNSMPSTSIETTHNYFCHSVNSSNGDFSPHLDHSALMSMDDQERKKLDRKRARNRQAATKCRQKKMDRIRELEEQVSSEKARSARLNNELSQLQSVLNAYRDAVTTHQNRGCRAS